MKTPGFSADASLYRTISIYRSSGQFGNGQEAVSQLSAGGQGFVSQMSVRGIGGPFSGSCFCGPGYCCCILCYYESCYWWCYPTVFLPIGF